MRSMLFSIILVCIILTQAHAWDGTEPLIADHNAVQQFDWIPDYWLEKAKELTVYFAHASHGAQIIAGLNWLEAYVDPAKYKFKASMAWNSNVTLPGQENPPALLVAERGAKPEGYWQGSVAQSETIQILNSDSYDLSGWQWCGEHSNTVVVQEYLDSMQIFENACPDVTFFYMTGASSPYRIRGNDLIRDYCINNNKILFDFADIEQYSPDGVYRPGYDGRGESWGDAWVQQNPGVYQNIPPTTERGGGGDNWMQSSHAHGLFTIMKAQAFWWMMARIAGWDGVSQEASGEPEHELGDVNGDGSINIIDVTLAARHAAELVELEGDALRRANVNSDLDGSGQPDINILDIILIARRAVGLITAF